METTMNQANMTRIGDLTSELEQTEKQIQHLIVQLQRKLELSQKKANNFFQELEGNKCGAEKSSGEEAARSSSSSEEHLPVVKAEKVHALSSREGSKEGAVQDSPSFTMTRPAQLSPRSKAISVISDSLGALDSLARIAPEGEKKMREWVGKLRSEVVAFLQETSKQTVPVLPSALTPSQPPSSSSTQPSVPARLPCLPNGEIGRSTSMTRVVADDSMTTVEMLRKTEREKRATDEQRKKNEGNGSLYMRPDMNTTELSNGETVPSLSRSPAPTFNDSITSVYMQTCQAAPSSSNASNGAPALPPVWTPVPKSMRK